MVQGIIEKLEKRFSATFVLVEIFMQGDAAIKELFAENSEQACYDFIRETSYTRMYLKRLT